MYRKLIDRWNERIKRRNVRRLRSVLTKMGYDLSSLSDQELVGSITYGLRGTLQNKRLSFTMQVNDQFSRTVLNVEKTIEAVNSLIGIETPKRSINTFHQKASK